MNNYLIKFGFQSIVGELRGLSGNAGNGKLLMNEKLSSSNA